MVLNFVNSQILRVLWLILICVELRYIRLLYVNIRIIIAMNSQIRILITAVDDIHS